MVTVRCPINGCTDDAEVVVKGPARTEFELCRTHFDDLLRAARRPIRVVSFLQRPNCFRPECPNESVTVLEDLDGSPLPICRRHLDALDWVDEPENLLSDLPGWSCA